MLMILRCGVYKLNNHHIGNRINACSEVLLSRKLEVPNWHLKFGAWRSSIFAFMFLLRTLLRYGPIKNSESEGFEPPVPVKAHQFSRLVHCSNLFFLQLLILNDFDRIGE